MFASVIVPTHNRAAKLLDCLHSLLALDHAADRYEIVVVDAASGDETEDVVRALTATLSAPPVSYLRSASADANAARNVGAKAARGPLLAFVDDDVIVPRGWLGALVDGARTHAHSGCFGGPIRPIYETSPPRTCSVHELAGARFDEGQVSKFVTELWGGNMAVWQETFDSIGQFREGLPVLQEWEWQERLRAAGGSMVYLPEAWLWHRRGETDLAVLPVLKDMFRRGYTQGVLGQSVALSDPARRGSRMLAHAIFAACTRGLGEFARETGLVAGELARRRGRKLA